MSPERFCAVATTATTATVARTTLYSERKKCAPVAVWRVDFIHEPAKMQCNQNVECVRHCQVKICGWDFAADVYLR